MAKRSLVDQLDLAITDLLAGREVPTSADAELKALLQVAAELRNLPRQEFKERLKFEMEGSYSMTAAADTMIPSSEVVTRNAATPYLCVKNAAQAIEFYGKAFGARETMRLEDRGKVGHAEIVIGNSVIMLADEYPDYGVLSPQTLGGSPVRMHLDVADVDRFVEKAVAAGAKIVRPVQDQFYGDRSGQIADPFGYSWTVATHKENVPIPEMQRRLNEMTEQGEKSGGAREGFSTVTTYLVAQDAAGLIEFVKKAFGGEEIMRSIGSGGGIHCEVRIGDSMLMIGGGGPGLDWKGAAIPSAFHIYVPDCDATYEAALQAGATSIQKPADQEYGERTASVRDAAGDHWYIATFKGESYKSEGAPTLQPYLHPLRGEPVINFLKRAFGAQEMGRYTDPQGVIHHTTLKIGSSQMELGEATGPYQPMPTMFYLQVPDADTTYRSALAAGATSMFEPGVQPYGDRVGAVKDAFGNQWFIATSTGAVKA